MRREEVTRHASPSMRENTAMARNKYCKQSSHDGEHAQERLEMHLQAPKRLSSLLI